MADQKEKIKALAKRNVEYLEKTLGLQENFTGNINLNIEVNNGGVTKVEYASVVKCN